jgi:N-methylhydantoinase A
MVASLLAGIDIGGTFTDFVVFDPASQSLDTFKLLSTPHNPAEAVLAGLRTIREKAESHGSRVPLNVIHGSTVATNALLERKGARTALVSTCGLKDIIQIGRQDRPSLYDLYTPPANPLIPTELRLEVDERIGSAGEILTALDLRQVQKLVDYLYSLSPESVAVCFLFSFLNPAHERLVGEQLRQAGFLVSLSFEVLPEYREYERTSTTAVNAYVSPVLDRYLSTLESSLPADTTRLRVMQSNGGQISLAEARRSGVRCILSGPAGGVIGALAAGRLANTAMNAEPDQPIRLVTFDMGGTSTDVSLIDGSLQVTTESIVGGCPIRVPVLDIHTIGAGGGSIACIDPGGALRVGPESAGADPGPACYGRSDPETASATVTDANLVLGRLDPDRFLGGKMPLDVQRAILALERLGKPLGLSPQEAALGVIEVVNAHMERALRVISVERGRDPHDFALLSFGGAGGLHAVDLARRLDIPTVLVPPFASTLSALGMLQADVVKDYTQTVMLPGHTPSERIDDLFAPLAARGQSEIESEGVSPEDIQLELSLDMRYTGQSYELAVPWLGGDTLADDFHAAHLRIYGYNRPDSPFEIVNLRVRAVGKVTPPPIAPFPPGGPDPSSAFLKTRPIVLGSSGPLPVPCYRYESLQPGNRILGPALIVREDTSILFGPQDNAAVDNYLNIVISVHQLEE